MREHGQCDALFLLAGSRESEGHGESPHQARGIPPVVVARSGIADSCPEVRTSERSRFWWKYTGIREAVEVQPAIADSVCEYRAGERLHFRLKHPQGSRGIASGHCLRLGATAFERAVVVYWVPVESMSLEGT